MLRKHQLISNNWVLLVCFVLLPACYKKLTKKAQRHYYDEQPLLTSQANLVDIPLPIQSTVHKLLGSTAESSCLVFTSIFSLTDIVKFYQLEMERLGWKELQLFSVTSEVLLVFEKPQRFCTISIRPDNRVVIFFGNRS